MPGKLIAFIVALVVIVTFIGLNIENSSDIKIWFGEKGNLEDVPIFVSFFIMYLVGVLSVIPFILSWNRKRNRKQSQHLEYEEPLSSAKRSRILGRREPIQEVKADSAARNDHDEDENTTAQ